MSVPPMMTSSREGSGGRTAGRERITRSLVLWSGGVDSTYSLLRVLRETGDRVFSHHVQRLPVSAGDQAVPRSLLEVQAIDALRPCVAARSRQFEHSVSRVDPGEAGGSVDAALLAFMAARVARVSGFTPFDRILLGVNGDRDPGWDPDSAACALRRGRLARAIRAAFGCDEVPQLYLWEPRPLRAAMLRYLGAELAALTVSCARPHLDAQGVAVSCGRCSRCRTSRPAVQEDVRSGESPGPAARRPPLFRHLVESQSRTQEPPGEASATCPPEP